MSELRRHPEALPATNEPLRVAVRRLRWFRRAFERHAQACGLDLGCRFEVDGARLAAIFVRWLRAVDAQKPADRGERRDFFRFAAALMLRELVADMPLRAMAEPTRAAPGSAGAFWPEGYACTAFCVSVLSVAAEQEFRETVDVAPSVDDLRHWWSLREHARDDAGFSAGFLQMILGDQPNWVLPDTFAARLRRDIDTPGTG